MSSGSKQKGIRSADSPAGLLSPRHPIWSLTISFWIWKAIIFLIVAACPGPGYDTSTTLLQHHIPALDPASNSAYASRLSIPLKFVRWDSLYFVHTVEYGYIFEQEWAFGFGYTELLRFLTSGTCPDRS